MGVLLHRPKWPNRIEYLERIEFAFTLYLQHLPYGEIARRWNAEHEEVDPDAHHLTIHEVKRDVQRAKALMAGSYARNLQQLAETSTAQRYAIVAEAWAEIHRVEADPSIPRAQKAQSKALLMGVLDKNFSAVEELLGVRNQDEKVTHESKTLVVIGGDTSANRIAAMGKLLNSRSAEPVETIIDQVS